jgi:hypothetical protein
VKKIIGFLLLNLLTVETANAGDFTKNWLAPPEPRATFDKIWVDYDITEDGVKGMRIHLKFSAYGMKDMDAYVAVYFEYNDEVGGYVKDKNQKYNSTEGDAALYKSIRPAYDPSDYNDLQLFMPYNELDLEPGEYDISMDIKVIYKAGGAISQLTKYNFEYSKPGSPTIESGTWATADFKDLRVDYDVTENNEKGMRVHVKCTLKDLKGIDCYLALYFQTKNGEYLKGTQSKYRSTTGNLSAFQLLRPTYDASDYDDLNLFIPYSEFNLSKGRHDLKMIADIIYPNGNNIKHLKTHDFWFEK